MVFHQSASAEDAHRWRRKSTRCARVATPCRLEMREGRLRRFETNSGLGLEEFLHGPFAVLAAVAGAGPQWSMKGIYQ